MGPKLNPACPVLIAVTLALCLLASASAQESVEVQVTGEVLSTVPPDFFGLHYDGPEHHTSNGITGELMTMPGAYGSQAARKLLRDVGVSVVRIFLTAVEIRPDAGTWNWDSTDRSVAQVIEAGMRPMLCLRQAGPEWIGGTAETGWWKTETGRAAWDEYASEVARRYGDRCRWYEVFNEPNIIHAEKPDCFGWDGIAEMYLVAARAIRAQDADAIIGGAATWAAWETAEFGRHVLKRPDGEAMLDFVSYHIYTTHSLEESNETLMSRTPWFRETPAYIRAQLAPLTDKRILAICTEYNSNAIWSKDGKPFTDKRCTNAFGGILSASVLCNSALGAADMVMHFATIGGFGLIVWPPEYQPQACYFAHALLHQVAGLRSGSQMLKTTCSLPPETAQSAVRGELTDAALETYAVRDSTGILSVILVHKRATPALRVSLKVPGDITAANLYRYSARRIPDSLYPVERLQSAAGALAVDCEPYSITVVRFGLGSAVAE